MNQFRQKFQQDLKSQAQKEKKLGKLIIVSGMSGAGKSVVGDIIDNIMRYYEEGRDWSPNAIDHYLQTASRYASKYKRNLTNEMNSKEEII